MSVSATVLLLFISWTIVLLLAMEIVRGYLVLAGRVKSNEFRPDNANLSPFMQRLTRAHANCLEGLPVIGGVLLLALATGRSDVTDALAPWVLLARVVQSSIHVASTSNLAVNARFAAFAVQIGIAIYWVWMLLLA
ncbi:MAPEG family protein [Chitinimonas sp. BJYL2]|uniref:MAPEG family protein n=1 Tax=Chitinimonas sp. BJYL2 TaxID=2976696 RepID=UPI0022B53066|nr:MAPEG family protein [Chitinimonas sp. BJYL2]